MQETKGPNPIDVHVGLRVRLRRKELGISQSQLAEGLGLTFQEVQKYERGANRISASKLFELARLLQTEISYFFVGSDALAASTGGDHPAAYNSIIEAMLAEPSGPLLADAFLRIKTRSVRKALADLACGIAANDNPAEPGSKGQ